ncbi:MAG TPA: DUF1501 domain-containing protein [Planctomycetaceae bacterium]|nr:DUF1501 domain-containing protein [Planctomycetaceae bacterium]
MLSLGQQCGRYGRREFLRIGGLALGGLSLPGLLAGRAEAAAAGRAVTGKSVVFLFLHGGPSQIETFDPKMTAPPGVRSVNGEVQTALPGVTFGAALPRLAALADRLAIVRSFVTGDGNHDIKPIVGRDTFGANLGSLYARVVGANDPRTGLPTNALLFPQAVDSTTMPGIRNFGDFASAGGLGSAYQPFEPGTGGELQRNMQLTLPMDRLGDRRLLLERLDQVRFAAGRSGFGDGLDEIRAQAFSTILGGAAEAFDLSREDPRTIARYDTAPLVRPEHIDRRWNNYERYVDNAKSLGRLMLLARRLCEAGVGFVTVTTNFVWDMHADQNNAGVEEGMRYMGLPFDHAVSTFLEDVAARGLSDRILLVACGEMGRTPRINDRGGRDHWGNLAPLLLAGGGLRMGQVIGQSTRDAGEPLSEPYGIRHLIATVLHTLFDVGELRLERNVPPDLARAASDWEPIRGLLA